MSKGTSQKGDKIPPGYVTVCVIDDEKELKKSYLCSRELLAKHVGYLAEQFKVSKLEITEVSIHCNINTFNWLIQWIRKVDSSPDQLPVLDIGNVFPVLVSAEFLVMKALISRCLQFIHENIKRINLTPNVLQILGEDTISRLCDQFANCEVEAVGEGKDALKGRLYTQLTEALLREGADPRLGHLCGLRSLSRCSACGQLVRAGVSFSMWCTPENIVLSPSKGIINLHRREDSWDARDHARRLAKRLDHCPRTTYWRLWGQCHMLLCTACRAYFPAGQMGWCLRHPDEPRAGDDSRWTYPCCQAPAVPRDPLHGITGCHFREHCPRLETRMDHEIFRIYSKHKELIALPDEYKQSYKQNLQRNFIDKDKYLWWTVLKESPANENYFVPNIWEIYPNNESVLFNSKKNKKGVKIIYERVRIVEEDLMPRHECESGFEKTPKTGISNQNKVRDGFAEENFFYDYVHASESESSDKEEKSSDSSSEGEVYRRRIVEKQRITVQRSCTGSLLWSPLLPGHVNTHSLHEHERRCLARTAGYLERLATHQLAGRAEEPRARRSKWTSHVVPKGGIFVRLESEWLAQNPPETAKNETSSRR
ncbi:SANT and BTB domain regulator of class switch recombination-like [Bacillus rossius redtenbacheri]|uniref:SANT and BTB domain regulator of class switch recombination-like n=1 Tax=Bacillus rossius redtenbacheri TaxID=93214 RepID=UPI002FDDD066